MKDDAAYVNNSQA